MIVALTLLYASPMTAQISPGDLAEVHSHLEGISNCTKCHTLGAKVTNDNCLECHQEIKSRLILKKGYHYSPKIKGKECVSCHSDHHGRKFEIVRFNTDKFDHDQTGFKLVGAHSDKTCKDCHKAENIDNIKIREKQFTYLGLRRECLTCHDDYHQQTLQATCSDCHNNETFTPASKFNHSTTAFQLTGKHQTLTCADCHAITSRNGVKFQEFANIPHSRCTDCHRDPHLNKFGQKCQDCHSTTSFHNIMGMAGFNHSKTGFPLENRHADLKCSSCHKRHLTDPLKHEKCTDCHEDYHSGDFIKQGIVQSCSYCHSTKGFAGSSFTIERHNESVFQLKGAHLATPCFVCHKKNEKWSFREIGRKCVDCHSNIHDPYISEKYYPESDCRRCHQETQWVSITFDHSITGFELAGTHAEQSCRTCHFKKDSNGVEYQVFSELTSHCTTCHQDIHYQQFDMDEKTDCLRCHTGILWKIRDFDHNKTAFKLDGKHQGLACTKCHKPVRAGESSYLLYKIGETRCEHCH